jgi:hypothetical protein
MMWVVDTNVAVVANNRSTRDQQGQDRSVDPECRLASQRFLRDLLASGRIAVDDTGEIQAEYRRHLNAAGQPGVGDEFYRAILMSHPDKIVRIAIGRTGEDEYDAFPNDPALEGFDRSDRKFVAVALVASVPVVNATDSDWVNHDGALSAHGLEISYLCGCDMAKWFTI